MKWTGSREGLPPASATFPEGRGRCLNGKAAAERMALSGREYAAIRSTSAVHRIA
jgi:hypothetical protein